MIGGAPRSGDGGPNDAAIASFLPNSDYWVSAPLVRQAIGAWAYSLAGADRRPTPEAVRTAVGVACAIRELALELERGVRPASAAARSPDAPLPVPADGALLGERAGVAARDVAKAVELLAASGVADFERAAGVATVSLSNSVLAQLPAVARLAWAEARDRLRRVDASVAPALAVLRELGSQVGAVDDALAVPALRVSVRDLEDTTGYGRSTVSTALDALERARLLDIETRAGRTTRFGLRPAAFGRPDELPRPSVQDVLPDRRGPVAGFGTLPTGSGPGLAGAPLEEGAGLAETPAVPSISQSSAQSPGHTGAPVLLGSFAGIPVYAPLGTPLVVECDAHGRWTCQVGPFLRLGPVDPPGR
jgi:DNA-binding transcriptional ArsR family regulator